MKIGYSTLACPYWDLNTILDKAVEYGYQGVEIRVLQGNLDLPRVSALADQPDHTRGQFVEKGVALVCLSSSESLDSKKSSAIEESKATIREFIQLASRLGCPFVKIFSGDIQGWFDNKDRVLTRIVRHLQALAPVAAKAGVTILVENSGDLSGSDDIWFIVDAVGHPNVQCCWNQVNAMTQREAATTSVPRLGSKIALVHLCDADFEEDGILKDYKPLGSGMVEVGRQIEILKGIVFDGWAVVDWPKLWFTTLPDAEQFLPTAAKYIRARIDEKQPILTAYKGDKQATRFAKARPFSSLKPATP